MHGCSLGSAALVNAEVDSMGGVVDGGVGIDIKTSPRLAAINKAQAELRQEYDVREERRRELEFLEKGGNPLDLKFGKAASISVQSTSFTDQHPEHFVTSAAKDSFALTPSPHGDSIESSGRPGAPVICEPNSADNLLLFNHENKSLEGEKNSIHSGRRIKVVQSEQSSQIDTSQNAKESDDSAFFRPYARRNRSRSNRDVARSSSTGIIQSRGHGSSLHICAGSRDVKGPIVEKKKLKDQNITFISNPKSACSNGDMVPKSVTSDGCKLDMEVDGVQSQGITIGLTKDSQAECRLDVTGSKSLTDNIVCTSLKNQDHHTHTNMDIGRHVLVGGREEVVSAAPEFPSYTAASKPENGSGSCQLNGLTDSNIDRKISPDVVQNGAVAYGTKGLEPESSCTQNSLSIGVNNDNDLCTNPRNADSNTNLTARTPKFEGTPNLAGSELDIEKTETEGVASGGIIAEQYLACQNIPENCSLVKSVEEICRSSSGLQNEVHHTSNSEGLEPNDHIVSEIDRKDVNLLGDNFNPEKENIFLGRPQGTLDLSIRELSETTLTGMDSACARDLEACSEKHLKLVIKADEDILEEARIIEAKRKRIAELSVGYLPLDYRQKSHWDFVLEEMAWLANDFAQERLWKITAAARLCRQVASTSRLRFEEQNKRRKLKNVADTLAKAVMKFWRLAEVLLNTDGPNCSPKNRSKSFDGNEVSENKIGEPIMEQVLSKEFDEKTSRKSLAVQLYAVRFLKYNSSTVLPLQVHEPTTPDKISDVGSVEMSSENQLAEENLFYSVPPGAMETYRKAIESYMVHCEQTGSIIEEFEMSIYDDVAAFGYQDAYDEDEGATSTFYLPKAFEGRKSSKLSQKKRKHLTKSYTVRSNELGTDFPYGHCRIGTQQAPLMGKRPTNSLDVGSIPTKRMRTATRQRVFSPFSAGGAGVLQDPAKTGSSGDTNSFQDDQYTLQGESQLQKGMEVESFGDFEKHLPYDYAETSTRPKKKKKAKHMGSKYEQGWQIDSTIPNEQRDHSRKRMESHYFDSNGTSGLYVQHTLKKPKIMKQLLDNTFDNPVNGSISSPITSQISSIPNSSKIIKLIGRDRGRRAKMLKMSAGQPGTGSPWSTFEDQALVVLVHDMGPNWNLVSDAINSTVQFKCIFRKPKECKERHKILIDSAGDGADSAEDSGSSQSYPSTLPGIPKGSARQLFQHLQGPMQEDNLKSHFEKIITIGQKQQYWRSQNDTQNMKQRAAVHNSQVVALSQVCPNNLNGGVLMPLDLCDTSESSPDVLSIGYQDSHANGLASIQGALLPILPTSAANSSLEGSSGMVPGSNLSLSPGHLNASIRDGRYSVPRTSSLSVDEQPRMQQYNQMIPGRNIQQPRYSVPGTLSGTDHGVSMLPGASGMACGMSRSMHMPGFQGIASSSMLNMISSSAMGIPSPRIMHSGAGPGQGNSMSRPREALHVTQPAHNPDNQRQVMVPEPQMQATQGNSQVMHPLNGLSSALCNQTTPPAIQTYPGHPQQQHQMSPQLSHVLGNAHLQGTNHAVVSPQQAYAIRLAKERQMQQRYLQQHQFAGSNALMPHVQPPPQLSIPASLQNNSQSQSKTPLSLPLPTPSSPMTPISSQHQHKNHLQPQSLNRNPQTGGSAMTNQIAKQRQRQPQQQQFQNSGRNQLQQRQHTQSQQQAKFLKGGAGRGSTSTHQNLSTDPSQLNGLSMASVSSALEKGEQITNLVQSQSLYSGSAPQPVQASKPLVPPQSSNESLQQKLSSCPMQPSSKQQTKQPQQMPSHSDNGTQGQVPPVPSAHTSTALHPAIPPVVMASNHQQLQLQPQLHQKQVNQIQPTVQRMFRQNRQLTCDPLNKSQTDEVQADLQRVNSVSQGPTAATVSQACIDPANEIPVVSSNLRPHSMVSDSVYDSSMTDLSPQVGSIARSPLGNSVGSGPPIPPESQGLGQMQLSGTLPDNGNNVGAQWQQQSPQILSPASPPPSQQYYQLQEQPVPQQEQKKLPQQKMPPLQKIQRMHSGQENLCFRPTNSKMD